MDTYGIRANENTYKETILALFVSLDQQNQQSSSSVFLSQQTSEQYFSHNKPAK
jgi:hypothetical protein